MAGPKKPRYSVFRRTGTVEVWRGGKKSGEFPEAGYLVRTGGQGTGIAGTLLAAHALAEVMLDVSPRRRRYVLTQAEYDEHVAVLKDWRTRLLERFPYLPEEAEAVEAHLAKYAGVEEQGRANVRRGLMNLSPYREDPYWNSNPMRRPPLEEETAEAAAPRM